MSVLIVVSDLEDWPLPVPGVRVVSAREYLTDPRYPGEPRLKVFNLCRSYRYQKNGYYVSLLATARGHRPLPSITTIQSMKSPAIVRAASDEIDDLIQQSLAPIHSNEFVLSVYFGRNLAKRHDRLAGALYRQFEAPLLRATFIRNPRTQRWYLGTVNLIAASDVPEEHREFLLEVATEHFARRQHTTAKRRSVAAYDLAILHDPDAPDTPSDERALKRFVGAAEAVAFDVELITKEDYGRLAEFDALFIRETTGVNHRTYRFSQRADAEGLVVVDDPDSIVKCSNKVFLTELLERNSVATPKSMIVHRGNRGQLEQTLSLPCVLKEPDSSFSQGVVKVETAEELEREVSRMLEKSDLIVAQQYVPTDFDWRIGVFDRQLVWACRYFMARRHWQIIKRGTNGASQSGRAETVSVEMVPTRVVRTALRAANLIGDGLYGVDIKQVDGKAYVIEVNDNPNVDAGVEDAVLKEELYLRIMRVFRRRIDERRNSRLYW
jgi:glutathione synthase/RimK-type ligase-like ATP-grasp enzyme